MTQVVFFVELFLILFLIVNLILKTINNRSEKNTLLFVLLFFMLLSHLKSIVDGDLPKEFLPQLTSIALLSYLLYLIYQAKGSFSPIISKFMDFKSLFSSEIIENFNEAVVLINNKTLEVVASNNKYKKLSIENPKYLSVDALVEEVLKGDSIIEFTDFDNKKQVYEIRLNNFGAKFALIYIQNITIRSELESHLKEEQAYFTQLWDTAPNLIMIRKISGEVVYVNPSMATFLRRPLRNLLNKHFVNIYNFKVEAAKHESIHEKLIASPETVQTHFLKLTHVMGNSSYFEATETMILYENEKHIITNAVDRSVEVLADLLMKSYDRIHKSTSEAGTLPYLVIDFMTGDIMFKERLAPYVNLPITSYNMFYQGLDSGSRERLNDMLSKGEVADSRPIVYKGKHFFMVEDVFHESHGNIIGVLIKYVTPTESKYSMSTIGGMVLGHIKEGLLIIDFDGKIEFANEMILRILDHTMDELVGLNILTISKGLTIEMVHRNWMLCKQHDSLHFERVYITKEGQEVPVEIVAMLLKHDDTEKLVLLVRDLMEKFIYKKKMVDSQTRYSQILESLQDGVFEIKLPEKTVTFYHEFDTEKGLVGLELNFLQWLNNIHDHDRSVAYEAIDMITSEKKENEQFEYRYFQKGIWKWVRSTGKYVDTIEGASIVVTNQDISEIKEISVQLDESKHILTESERISQMAHWKYEVGKNMFHVSDTFGMIVPISETSRDIHFEQLHSYIHASDKEYFEKKFYSFIWENESLNIIIRTIQKGEIHFIQFVGELYIDDDKVPIYAIGTILDITDKVRAQQKLEESKALLENVVEQTPMGIIVIKRNGYVEKINREAMHLLELDEEYPRDFEAMKSHIYDRYNIIDGLEITDLIKNAFDSGRYTVLRYKNFEVTRELRLYVTQMHDEENRFFGNILNIVEMPIGDR